MKKLSARIWFIVAVICSLTTASQYCAAQVAHDTARQEIAMPDTVVTRPIIRPGADATPLIAAEPKPFQPNPKKSGLYSALVPGLGQLYNRQYWKVPVVYVGLGVAGYFIITNEDNYQSYRKAYIGRINNPNPTDKYVGVYSQGQLQQLQNDYSKYLDLTILLSALGYTLQVIDAITAAHLKNFDISRDISMRVAPVATPNGVGLGLVMNF